MLTQYLKWSGSECDSLYTYLSSYLSKGVYPSDYIWREQEDTKIDTNGELFYAVVLEGKR